MAGLGRIAWAILGILAYQNRETLADLILGDDEAAPGSASPQPGAPAAPGKPGMLEEVVDGVGSGDGLDEVLDRFRRSGSGDAADSWVARGPNKPLTPEQVKAAIDPDTLGELADQTGLPPEELLRRIATDLPGAVDRLTPEGQLPTPVSRERTLLDGASGSPS